MGIITEIARVGVKFMFNRRFKFKFTYTDFDPKRKEPYVLLFNHAQLNDPLYVGMHLKYYPYPVASNLLYINPYMKFGLTKLVKSIPKRKGQSDSRTIRLILDAIHKDKRAIMIAPEGNSSFYGEQTPTDYTSTAKLVKKLNKDLVIAKISGGFLADPRWGKYRKKAVIEVDYYPIVKADEYDQYSVEEVAKMMEEAIAFDEYEWVKEKNYHYKHKDLAVGIENYLYVCPKCEQFQTLSTNDNDIICKHCGTVATFNDQQFLDGRFDTLIKWSHFQQDLLKQHLHDHFHFNGEFMTLDLTKDVKVPHGIFNVIVKSNEVIVKNEKDTYHFDIKLIGGLTLTQKNTISFDYEKETYLLKINDSMLFHDLIKNLKGEQS